VRQDERLRIVSDELWQRAKQRQADSDSGRPTSRATRALDQLGKTLAGGDVARARRELKTHVGTVTVEADEREVRLYGYQGQMAAVLLQAAGAPTAVFMVAGAIWAVPSILRSERVK